LADAVPVTLITGFLGTGKTTLLNRLLRDPLMAKTAVLINEFGPVGLDHLLVERLDDATLLLEDGCICCTVREDLQKALLGLLPRIEAGAIKRVVIETTGIADPVPILETLIADPMLQRALRLDGVITLVDAVYGELSLKEHPEARRQIAFADRLLLTKTDMIDTPILRAKLAEINQAAPVIAVRDGAVALADIIDLGAAPPVLPTHDHHHHHGEVQSFCLTFDKPLHADGFGNWIQMLIATQGEKLLRVKGVLDLVGQDRPVTLHAVRHLLHPPALLEKWPEGPRQSRIVFVTNGISREVVESGLRAFERAAEEAASL
jgi:G3E family GTPase